MKVPRSTFLCVLMAIAAIGVVFADRAGAQQADRHARDLVQLSSWFQGEFDNDEQIWFENDFRWQGAEEHKHRRNHASHIRIDAPVFGEHVFYVEEYADGDPSNVWRRRLVTFDTDSERGLRMKIYFYKDASQFDDADRAATAEGLTVDDVMRLPECDVWLERVGEQYEGEMDPKACAFGEGEKRRYSEHRLVISRDQYWRVDKTWLLSTGDQYAGETSDEPTRMRRADLYVCDVKLPYESYANPHPNDVAITDLVVHDQGGTVEFADPKTGTKSLLQLRDKEYPYYEDGADFFLLRIKEVDAKFSTALVTTEPNPGKLSVNLGKLLVACRKR